TRCRTERKSFISRTPPSDCGLIGDDFRADQTNHNNQTQRIIRMNVPFKVNLKDQVALVTGGGGVLCSCMARALAACGAKIAVADLKQEAAETVAALIRKEGGVAISVGCNALERASLDAANDKVKKELGPVDILINGAGGNHPKGTTSLEYLRKEDIANAAKEIVTFYDLDPKGVEFVFNLNFLGTLLPTQAFTREMVGK